MNGQILTTPAREWQWNPKREQAALLRSQGKTWAKVAKEIGLSEKAARQYTLAPEFRQRILEHQAEQQEQARSILSAHLAEAADTVVEIMRDGRAKLDEPRLAAAQDILDRGGVKPDMDPRGAAALNVAIVNVEAVELAERVYLAVLSGESVSVGGALYTGQPSRAGYDSVRALSLSGAVPDGQEPVETGAQEPTGRHESDRGT